MTPQKTISDGIVEKASDEFQSFIREVSRQECGKNPLYRVSIPLVLAKRMQLKHHDKLLVAIKIPTDEELKEYITYPCSYERVRDSKGRFKEVPIYEGDKLPELEPRKWREL